MRSTSASSIARSSKRARRSRRSAIDARFGSVSASTASVIGPAVPPAIPISSALARSIAARGNSGSTPRSKRCDASVCMPSLRARPMIADGAKCALSRKTLRVASVTRESWPPMTPAERERLRLVGDDEEFRIDLRLAAVEQFQRFADATAAHDDRAGQRVIVERMQRLAEFEHDQIGHVDDRADRTQAAATQAFGQPQRRLRARVDAFDHAAQIARAIGARVDAHRAFGGAGDRDRFRHRRMERGIEQRAPHRARDRAR